MLLPPRLLSVTVTNIQPADTWDEDDGSGDPWVGFPYRWTVSFDVTAQGHSSHRTTSPFFYTGDDVNVGDWLGFLLGGTAVQIISIVSKTASNVVAVCEDVDRFNIFSDPSQQGLGIGSPGPGFVFQLGEEGTPILAPMTSFASTLSQNVAWQLDQLGRFAYRNMYRSYFRVEQIGHTFQVGDVVRIRTENPNQGLYEKVTAGSAVEGVVGVVNGVGVPGVNWFTYRPSGRVVTNLFPLLPGVAGDFIYVNNVGGYTTTRPSAYAKPIFIRLTGNGSLGLQLDRNVDVSPATGFIAQTYVVDDLAERDALTGINEGDQVKVRDNGNGEWAQFIWDDNSWVLVVTQDAANTDAETLEVEFTANGTYVLGSLSSGSRVTLVTVTVDTPFNPETSVNVGVNGDPASLMSADLSDLSATGSFSATPAVVFDSPGDTEVRVLVTGVTSAGSAKVAITYT